MRFNLAVFGMTLFRGFIVIAIFIVGVSPILGMGIYTGQLKTSIGNLKSAQPKAPETPAPSAPKAGVKQSPKNDTALYDVVVFGGTPEGVAAAYSSFSRGLKVCLVYEKDTLGGVWANGKLNQLDNTYFKIGVSETDTSYSLVSKGLNEGFMKLLGIKRMDNGFYDGVFDTDKVTPAFEKLLDDNGIDHIAFDEFTLELADHEIRSVKLKSDAETRHIKAKYFVDASENGDLAATAGSPYTLGRGQKIYGTMDRPVEFKADEYGTDEAQMSSTLMFRLGGVDWELLSNVEFNGVIDRFARSGNAGWGYNMVTSSFNNNPQSMASGIMLSGLNLGRQSDGSVLVNGLLVFDVDGSSDQSVEDGVKRAKEQLPAIVAYLKDKIPAFKNAYLIDVADTLYIRESRHFIGEYILTASDLLSGAQPYDTVAVANHAIDIHPYTPEEAISNLGSYGSLVDLHLQPKLYGVPFRSLLPVNIDNLIIVGRTISSTPKAAASARVVSIGISEAQAVGNILSISKRLNRPLKDLAFDEAFWMNNVIE